MKRYEPKTRPWKTDEFITIDGFDLIYEFYSDPRGEMCVVFPGGTRILLGHLHGHHIQFPNRIRKEDAPRVVGVFR
jgi:hypothetical protein